MPPRFKFTKEEIIDTCFSMAKKEGLNAITARGVATELGSSSKVIFGLFKDMEELRFEVVEKAKDLYKSYVEEGLSTPVPFKGVGESYIRFAKEEPKFFQLLFMREKDPKCLLSTLMETEESYEKILSCIESYYGLKKEDAVELYKCLWIATHGIAVMCVTGLHDFSDEEIQDTLSKIIKGLLMQFKKIDQPKKEKSVNNF